MNWNPAKYSVLVCEAKRSIPGPNVVETAISKNLFTGQLSERRLLLFADNLIESEQYFPPQ